MPALGEEFRSAREARGLTLSDVAEQIHIRSVYLNAIENEDWKAIGAAVYVRGFLRTYARFLGVDAEDAVARFNLTAPPERSTAITSVSLDDDARSGPSLWLIVGGLVALVLLGFVAYEYWQYLHAPAPVTGSAAPQPTAAPAGSVPPSGASALPSAVPSGSPRPAGLHHTLAIHLTERSWLRVTVDGATKLEGLYPAGLSRTFTGNVAEVRAGNAAGVRISVNGRAAATMGKAGDVVEQQYTL